MKTKRLGSHGPEISVVGFGSWEAGGGVWGDRPDEQSISAMEAAIGAGMNWIDTAEIYGAGRSERLVGRVLAAHPDVMVFTKVAPKGAGSGFEPAQVRAAAEQSLERLGRDVIDLYQLHWPDRRIPVERTWEAMARLVDDGIVRWIGVSNFDRRLIERCETIRHVESLQPQFSLLHQEGRDDLFPFCDGNGTGIICYGPLAYGLLTGAITKETKFADDDWRSGNTGVGYYYELFAPRVFDRNLAIVDALRPVAKRLGITVAQLSLAWVFHQRGSTAAIAGSRSAKHAAENAAAGEVELSADDLSEIDRVVAQRQGATS